MLLIPAICLYCLALIGPLFFGTVPSSFYDWNIIKAKRNFAGLENFLDLFHDKQFLTSLLFTLKLGVVTVTLNNIIAFAISFFLNENVFAKGFTRSMFFMPNTIGGIMVAFIYQCASQNLFSGRLGINGVNQLVRQRFHGVYNHCRGSRVDRFRIFDGTVSGRSPEYLCRYSGGRGDRRMYRV